MLKKIETAKIAFVGSDNNKKMEIAKLLNQHLDNEFVLLTSDLPIIKRQMGITVENNTSTTQYALQWSLLTSQIAKERAITSLQKGFISDCCVIDYLAGAIQKVEDKKLTSSSMFPYFQVARDHIKNYDLIAYVPFEFNYNYDSQLTNWHDNVKRKRLNDIVYGELIKNDVKFITLDKPVLHDNVNMLSVYLKTFM